MEQITSRKNKVITHIRKLGSDNHYRRISGELSVMEKNFCRRPWLGEQK